MKLNLVKGVILNHMAKKVVKSSSKTSIILSTCVRSMNCLYLRHEFLKLHNHMPEYSGSEILTAYVH